MSSRKTALSVGFINLVTCWFGAMPVCHGSGGLAAQYRFGARTGGSVVFVGVLKIVLGAAFASTAVAVMAVYPASVLGVLLVFAALELARPAMDQTELPNFIVALLTAAVIGLVNTIAGVAVGLILAFTIQKRAR
jgi:MFS superfamily sulfate permease-like transporter